MIILTIQGAGKTYAAQNINNVTDVDIKDYRNVDDYVNVLNFLNDEAHQENSFFLGNASYEVTEKLLEKGHKVVIFAPFKDLMSEDEYQMTKELLFGRYVLRKRQTPQNVGWIEKMKENFDNYCNISLYSDLNDKYPGKLSLRVMNLSIPTVAAMIKKTK